jgi:hypothetical protein
MNAVVLSIPCSATMEQVRMHMCKCVSDIEHPEEDTKSKRPHLTYSNPCDAALAAALILNAKERLVMLQNNKNKTVELRKCIYQKNLLLTFVLPPDSQSLN